MVFQLGCTPGSFLAQTAAAGSSSLGHWIASTHLSASIALGLQVVGAANPFWLGDGSKLPSTNPFLADG